MQAEFDPFASGASAAALRATAPARAFEEDELKALTLAQLKQIIRDQVDNIHEPLPKAFQLSKANKPKVIATLLDPKYGFRTRDPKLSFEAGYGVRKHAQHARRGRASAAGRGPQTGLVQSPAGTSTISLARQSDGQSDMANTSQGVPFFDPPLDIPSFDAGALGQQEPPLESSIAQLYGFAPVPFKTLIIYIRDVRDVAIGELTVPDRVEVKVPVTYTKHDKYIANWHDIIREIQGTASAIRGRYAKLSYSRSYQDDFKVAILQADDMRVQDVSITHPSIVLDESLQYCLHVDPLKDPVRRRAPSPEVAAARETLQRLASLGPDNKVRSMVELRLRGRSRQLIEEDANARDYEWLQGELRKRGGYEKFRDMKHNTKMRFSEVIKQWRFAVEFMDDYKGRTRPHAKKRVRKRDIQDVLDRGQTWLNLAKKGHCLYNTHQDHPDVVAALGNPEAKGYDELFQLLNRISQS